MRCGSQSSTRRSSTSSSNHPAVVAEWRTRILQAVGSNGSLVTDLFPPLLRLIGTHPPVPELPPTEASQRMISTLTSFLVKFCVGPKRPLILFFDDIQWADKNSMSLMESFAMHPDCQFVSFIGAYRSEEVDDQHVVTSMITHLREASIPVVDIDCPALALDICRNWCKMHCTLRLSEHCQLLNICNQRVEEMCSLLVNFCFKCREIDNWFIVCILLRPPAEVFDGSSALSRQQQSRDIVGEWRLASLSSSREDLSSWRRRKSNQSK